LTTALDGGEVERETLHGAERVGLFGCRGAARVG
jgi:hypothetical protein